MFFSSGWEKDTIFQEGGKEAFQFEEKKNNHKDTKAVREKMLECDSSTSRFLVPLWLNSFPGLPHIVGFGWPPADTTRSK
jgi:hypothetical protein